MAENRQEQLNSSETALPMTHDVAAQSQVPAGAGGRLIGVVADIAQPGPAAERLRDICVAENYEVVWTTPREVIYGPEEIADVWILDAETTDVNAVCNRLKHISAAGTDENNEIAPLLALTKVDDSLESLIMVGIDEFISENDSDVEIKARLAMAIRLGRAQRDLQVTREELRHQIQVDDLSGTLNRRFFFQSAYRECSRARRYGQALSCLMVDIDHFHLYNTTFGYGCGDYILREVANVLKSTVRDTDLVARFGGSKFVILLTHTDTEGAVMVRQKIEDSIKGGYFVWQHQRLPVTVSIGEAERVPGRSHPVSPEEGEEDSMLLSTREDLAELLEDADSALYIAKKGARFPAFLETAPEHVAD